MDHSFTYHHPLAQMPTDQREHEHQQHRVSVQTGLYQMASTPNENDPQPDHPGPQVENSSAFRSNLTSEALVPLHHQMGFSTQWRAMLDQYALGSSSLTGVAGPDTFYLASFYSTPHANMHRLNSHAPSREHTNFMNWQTASTTTSFLPSQGQLGHSSSYSTIPEQSRHSMRATPTSPSPSPPISISSSQSSRQSCDSNSMSPAPNMPAADSSSPRISLEGASDQEQNGGLPYSRLIWEALMSTEEKMLPLQGIYQWFEKNTNKGGNEDSKGWQNSIRHNLSMNAGFEPVKVEAPGKKSANYWRLTEEAIRHGGVQSTTRYRKLSVKKALSSDPNPRRPRPGSRGGMKIAGVKRHVTESEGGPSHPYSRLMVHDRNVRQQRSPPLPARPQPQLPTHVQHFPHYHHSYVPNSPVGLPQYAELNVPNGLANSASNGVNYGLPNVVPNVVPIGPSSGLPEPEPETPLHWRFFDFSSVIGTTNPPPGDSIVFCDSAEGVSGSPAFVGPWVGITQT
ncbi:Forkhead box protein O1 [Penicillium rolfsii]|nr:Forkhead box protein O1 [Penicillium rolfsii]